jgi:disulfide oxidoreductase YuzD
MEPVTAAIIAALAKLGESAIRDGYDALKAAIKRKFGESSEAAQAVEKLEAQPDSAGRRAVAQEELAKAKANEDAELVAEARALLEKVRETSGGRDVVEQVVHGNHNIFSGTGDVNVKQG